MHLHFILSAFWIIFKSHELNVNVHVFVNKVVFFTLTVTLSFRYFYRHLMLFYSENPVRTEKSIFCPSPGSKLLTLKQNTTVFLYMNQLPKGAAQLKSQM